MWAGGDQALPLRQIKLTLIWLISGNPCPKARQIFRVAHVLKLGYFLLAKSSHRIRTIQHTELSVSHQGTCHEVLYSQDLY